MQKFVTTGNGVKQERQMHKIKNRHIFTVGANVDLCGINGEDDKLSSIQKAIKNMNALRQFDFDPHCGTTLSVDNLVDQKRVLATMLFDIDEYKATKRSLGHQENEIALELKRLQNSNYLPSTVTLGRSLSRQRSRLHCSQIDFTRNTDEYSIPNKDKTLKDSAEEIETNHISSDKSHTISCKNQASSEKSHTISCKNQASSDRSHAISCTNQADSCRNDEISDNAYEEPCSIKKTNKLSTIQKDVILTKISTIAENNGSDKNHDDLDKKKISHSDQRNHRNGSISVEDGKCNKSGETTENNNNNSSNFQRQGYYDFKCHIYICIGILVAFVVWAIIYFTVAHVSKTNVDDANVST